MEGKIFGLRKNVFFLGLVSLFNDFSNEMIQAVMPVFLAVNLGVSPIGIGLIEGAADAVASFVKIFSGWFSDKIGRRKLPAVLGYTLSVSTRPFFALVGSFPQVFTLRIIDRMGKGFREGPRDALLSVSADHEELGKSFGYHRAMDAVGGMLGPLFAFLILPVIGYRYNTLFLIAFSVGLLAIFSFIFVKEIRRPDGLRIQTLNLELFREHHAFTLFIAAVFLFGLGAFPITLMLLKPIQLGINIGNIPLIYFIYSISFVLAAIPFGRLSDKIGQRAVITAGFVFAIFSYVSLAFIHNLTAATIAFILFGLYSAATDGVERALAARIISEELLATGEGILNAAVGLSSLLSGLFGGLIWTKFGADVAFVYAAMVSSLGLIVFSAINLDRWRRGKSLR